MAEPENRFDVFLSHNSKDKPAVIALAKRLQANGVKVWLDAWELRRLVQEYENDIRGAWRKHFPG